MRYRLTSDRYELNKVERWAIEGLIAWRIIAMFAIGIIATHFLTGFYVDAGLSKDMADVAVFLTLNVTFFAACYKYWSRSIFPIAPAGWRRGTKAKVAVIVLIAQLSVLAFAPLGVQLMVALALAWYRFNVA
ncbi:hypothetical protein FPZ24_07305 [Sphingomonas panacisoli]|uniref:Uncharacterized protein n=1 Tax=Sphingomonas panacisoli TaxID=1813879 RepID=A0A5B8LGA0_9SPHN|nr:hypothetical protein [Sphingomonas panacisoli]QDZ07308.1 hypothetical protein FPZ24_07305 [Sphingomonas panacisoli]